MPFCWCGFCTRRIHTARIGRGYEKIRLPLTVCHQRDGTPKESSARNGLILLQATTPEQVSLGRPVSSIDGIRDL
jgi:hypothetical protein